MEQPNYYGIIPANVRYNKDLTLLEKFLYCEFTALSNLNGYCCSRNTYFATLYDKDKATISRAISHLEELNFIHIEYEKQGARVLKRKIYPLDIKTTNDRIVNRTETTDDKNVTREQLKMILTVDKIVKDNNVSYDNIIYLILDILKKEKKESEVLDEYKFDAQLLDVLKDWLKYKREKGKTYKPIGLKHLCDEVKMQEIKNGSTYVIEQIKHSMASGWDGIVYKQAFKKESKQTNNSFMDMMQRISKEGF